jgi:hypothetical protein
LKGRNALCSRRPSQHPRLDAQYELRGWLGELEGIEISLNAAREKLSQMVRQVSLGMPAVPSS